MFVYVCNSDFAGGSDGRHAQDGVSVFALDPASGGLRHVQTVPGLRSPSYLARNPIKPLLYVAERWINADKSTPSPEQQRGDGIATFRIAETDGMLTPVDRRSTGGAGPMHLNVTGDGRYAFAANPGRPKDPDPARGHVTAIGLDEAGLPARVAGSAVYDGPPPLWRERPKPYPHSVFGDTDWQRLLVCQLMADRVTIYDFSAKTGAIAAAPGQTHVQVSSGAGPRHVAFHPNGRCFYVVNSLDASLSAFSYDPGSGGAEIVQTTSLGALGFGGARHTSLAHALVSPDGGFLYCCHRTDNSIAVFSIDPRNGELRFVQRQDCLGARPFHLAMDQSGRFILVANQKSSQVVSFQIEADSGTLRPTGKFASTYSPNCIAIG